MNWKNIFKKGKEIILATASGDGKPNANIVISLGLIKNNLLVADCEMKRTIRNLEKNGQICVIGGYLRIRGKAKIFSSGKYFDFCVKNSKGYTVKNAILISIEEIFDLNEQKNIFSKR